MSRGLTGAVPLATVLGMLVAGVATGAQPDPKAAQQPPVKATAATTQPAPARGITGLDRAVRRSDGAIVIRERLGGSGVIPGAGHRIIEGTLAPGDSPGCVTDQGNVTFTGTGSLEIEIAGPTPCTQYDRLTVNLALTLDAATLRVVLLDGYAPAAGARFDVLDWGTLTGTFGTLVLPALPSGLTWDTSSLYTTGELAVASSGGGPPGATVPLPPWALAGLALALGLAGLRAGARRKDSVTPR